MSRPVRRLLVLGCLIAGTVILVLAAYSIEERLGRREWDRVRSEMEKRGEKFTFSELAPSAVPDDQNFAATPLLRPLLDYTYEPKTNTHTWRDPAEKERIEKISLEDENGDVPVTGKGWREGEFVDLEKWAAYFRTSKSVCSSLAQTATST